MGNYLSIIGQGLLHMRTSPVLIPVLNTIPMADKNNSSTRLGKLFHWLLQKWQQREIVGERIDQFYSELDLHTSFSFFEDLS